MAENKKGFVLYCDLIHTVRKMPREKVAELFLTILAYVNDENPVVEDLMVDLVFEPIKQQLKRDLRKYEVFREKQVQNGKLGGRPKKLPPDNQEDKNPENPSLFEKTQKSLTVTVKDTVTVKEKDINGTHRFASPSVEDVKTYVLSIRTTSAENAQKFAEKFHGFYESKGWMVGKSKMKNWKACASSTWKDTLDEICAVIVPISQTFSKHQLDQGNYNTYGDYLDFCTRNNITPEADRYAG